MKFEIDRTRQLFIDGFSLADHLDRTLRSDFALFARGGLEILKAIERQNYNVLAARPRLSKLGKAKIFASTWLRSKLGISIIPKSAFESATRHTASDAKQDA